jgi:hypothetical protein
MKIDPKLFYNLLAASEYSEHLLHDGDGGVFINMKTIPKNHYLTLNDCVVDGYVLCLAINDHIHEIENGRLKVEKL